MSVVCIQHDEPVLCTKGEINNQSGQIEGWMNGWIDRWMEESDLIHLTLHQAIYQMAFIWWY